MGKSLEEQYTDSCTHFRGIQHQTCKAGVDWRALVGGDDFGIARRMPCLKDNNSTVVCEHCHFPTPEEVQARIAKLEAYMERQREDMALIGAAHEGHDGRSTAYICQLCDRAARDITRTVAEFTDHVTTAHNVSIEEIRAAKGGMAAHLDATDWFQNDDRFTLPDGRELLLRSTRTLRRGVDKAVWADVGEPGIGKGKRRRR